jgi:hypothetical protein
MTTPRLGAPELTEGQATPETTVNEIVRYLEQGAMHFSLIDRDLATPPGSPGDGDRYLVAASPTGAWTGHAGDIAFYMGTEWKFIEVVEGMTAYLGDEDVLLFRSGSAWNVMPIFQEWAPNFSSDGELYIPALVAMTIGQGNAEIGTGTITYEKSTTAAPSTISSTTLPATLQAGAWLKVSAASVTGFVATHLKRTA